MYCLTCLMRLVMIFVLLVLAACGRKETRRESRSTFRLNLSAGALESLDPAYAKDLYTMWTTHMVYNTLVETDSRLHIVPSLATHWEVSPDGMRYRFFLRRDVYFHNAPQFPRRKGAAHDCR
jgi:peptide/nickel transport system substrate-binding protein